jgi:paraquat-inducible protein A
VSIAAEGGSTGQRIGCPECDRMTDVPPLEPGQRARCARCGFVLSVCYADPFTRAVSFSVAALVLLGISLSFEFLTVTASGISNSMTLLQTAGYLHQYGANLIAGLVLIFVIVVPGAMLALILMVAMSLALERFHPLLRTLTRWLFHLNAWSMVEVFCIGVIVSLVKLSDMAKVTLGISFWAYLAFSVLFLMAFSGLDRLTVWNRIDRLCARPE